MREAHLATSISELRQHARRIRQNVLRMAKNKGDGYVGQGLDAADILATLYFREMKFDPQRLDWPERDRFLLSTGHYSIVLFATLTELGVFPPEELKTYGADGSRFEMSSCHTTPGVEITGGSLGHGLSQAVGVALGSRLSGRNFRVFNFLSDGELQEGVTWEAAMAAANFQLGQLIALIDVNDMQADGKVSDGMKIEPVAEKWRAFGWHTQVVDGNSLEALVAALEVVRSILDRPKAIVCYTKLGKGALLVEQRAQGHFVRLEPDEWEMALKQVGERE
ncbi:MAG: transketolase [Terriglobia bacterium]